MEYKQVIHELRFLYWGRDSEHFTFDDFNRSINSTFRSLLSSSFEQYNKIFILLLLYLKSEDPEHKFFYGNWNLYNCDLINEYNALIQGFSHTPEAIKNKVLKEGLTSLELEDRIEKRIYDRGNKFHAIFSKLFTTNNNKNLQLHVIPGGLYYCWLYYEEAFHITTKKNEVNDSPTIFGNIDQREYIINLFNSIPKKHLNQENGSLIRLIEQIEKPGSLVHSEEIIDDHFNKFIFDFINHNKIKSIGSYDEHFLLKAPHDLSTTLLFFCPNYENAQDYETEIKDGSYNELLIKLLASRKLNFNGFILCEEENKLAKFNTNTSNFQPVDTGNSEVFKNDVAIIPGHVLSRDRFFKDSDGPYVILNSTFNAVKDNGFIILQLENRSLSSFGNHFFFKRRSKLNFTIHSIIQFSSITWLILKKSGTKNKIRLFEAVSYEDGNRHMSLRLKSNSDIWKDFNLEESDCLRTIDYDFFLEQRDLRIKRFFAPSFQGEILKNITRPLKRKRTTPKQGDRIVRFKDLSLTPTELKLPEPSSSVEFTRHTPYTKIDSSCLLISVIGPDLKPTIFNYSEEYILIPHRIVALELDQSKCTLEFLQYALNSYEVIDQLHYIQRLYNPYRYLISDLLELKIKIPDSEQERKRLVQERKTEYLKKYKLEGIFKSLMEDQNQKLSIFRHLMAPYFNNIRSAFRLIEKKTEHIDDNVINQKLDIQDLNILEELKTLEVDFQKISELNENLRKSLDFESDKWPLEKSNLLECIEITKDLLEHNNRDELFQTRIQFYIEGMLCDINDVFVMQDCESCEFMFNRKAFEQLLLNFLDNTKKHAGFDKKNSLDNYFVVIFDLNTGTDMEGILRMIVANNGEPLKKGFTIKDFKEFGNTTNNSIGTGIGGNHIERLSNILRWEFYEIESYYRYSFHEEFPVQFKFEIPLEPYIEVE